MNSFTKLSVAIAILVFFAGCTATSPKLGPALSLDLDRGGEFLVTVGVTPEYSGGIDGTRVANLIFAGPFNSTEIKEIAERDDVEFIELQKRG